MNQQNIARLVPAPTGMRNFFVIWFGQLISLIGSDLTTFALGVWVYQQTGSVTLFALITLAGMVPGLLIAPVVGVLVDRWDRRRILIGSDTGSALITLMIAILFWTGQLALWQICLAQIIRSLIGAFQRPAFVAATTLLVPKQHLARASGMMQLANAVAQIIAPVGAGVLLLMIHLQGIFLIDFATFLVAVATLTVIRIPQPAPVAVSASQGASLLRQSGYGWAYIRARPGLVGLLAFFTLTSFAFGIAQVLFTPLVLKYASPATLGAIVSAGGVMLLIGTAGVSVWGGPKRRVYGILGFGLLFGASLMILGSQPSLLFIAIGFLCGSFCIPFINACNQAIWQVKVPPEAQGRVIATAFTIAMAATPLAYIIAGPLADGLFEPLLGANGSLGETVGRLIGNGPGRGIGLLLIIAGLIIILTAIGGFLYPRLRKVEDELPDVVDITQSSHQATPALS